ncbi:MAG: hypothetical protein JNM28_10955 [Armatimonadetes bacterium]|nr:hypothetical protein [Armatimonadota bacterium]
MSETVTAKPNNAAAMAQTAGIGMLVLGAVLAGAGLAQGFSVEKLAPSFLFGATFWIMLTMGCFGLMLLFHVTRGRWGTPVLRIFEAGASPINLVFCFVLVMLAATVFKEPLYGAWLHPAPGDTVVTNKSAYLNEGFFLARQVLYFVILLAFRIVLGNWTRKEEQTGDKSYSDKRNNLAAPGIVVFILTMTFFITDYLMSVEPHWYSTVWGFLFTIGACLSALALAATVVVTQKDKAPYAGKIDRLMMNDFGNLLLMLTMLWAYLSFSQLLIIWSGNLREFIPYYLKRIVGNYSILGYMLVFGQFLGPFLLLLSPRLKRTSWLLVPTAFLIMGMRVVDMYWLVMPYFRESIDLAALPGDLGVLLAFGGVWATIFAIGLRAAPLVTPAHPYQHHNHEHMEEATANV